MATGVGRPEGMIEGFCDWVDRGVRSNALDVQLVNRQNRLRVFRAGAGRHGLSWCYGLLQPGGMRITGVKISRNRQAASFRLEKGGDGLAVGGRT